MSRLDDVPASSFDLPGRFACMSTDHPKLMEKLAIESFPAEAIHAGDPQTEAPEVLVLHMNLAELVVETPQEKTVWV
ncbi:hypothetical protein M0R45_010352 [Rubus argutus]|uniref:Uncharacterized protein n=1 Tax=Rubus argutus TaxID=59490 RepID=A0AAW1Y7G3_RUBAR